MRAFTFLGAAIFITVLLEIALPGQALYRAGWWNVAIATLAIVSIARTRRLTLERSNRRLRNGVVSVAFGLGILAAAVIACGLLAPDPQIVVGAPGSSVRVDSLARNVEFPALSSSQTAISPVSASFLVRAIPRTVVAMQAFDARGGPLTITQPSGSAFLSPVLLMQARQTIAGLNLPYDSFAVPAMHRVIKAVLFTAQEAAALRGLHGSSGQPAVLFDVEDRGERSLSHGLAIARNGETIAVAGVTLRPNVVKYPAIDVIAIPNLIVVIIGLTATAVGAVLLRTPLRS